MLLDSVAKRQIAIASIALLQAYKIQTAFTQDSQFEILFLLDFLLLFAIYNFKIPKLVAPIWVYFAAYLAMSCLSAGIIGYVLLF